MAASVWLLAGCATPPPPNDPVAQAAYEEANDPLEPTNRAIFDFNQTVDKTAIRPAAIAYRDTLPTLMRDSIRNVLANAGSPVIFLNDVLQGETGRAAETAMRFFFNTIVGFFGLFDPAAAYGLERHEEDFGQTLAVWGVGEGPYIMLPIFGPSNVRDTVGKIVDTVSQPFNYLAANNGLSAANAGAGVVEGIDKRSRNVEALDEIEENALDFYATLRSLYRQNRRSEILNGAVTEIPVPEIEDEEE